MFDRHFDGLYRFFYRKCGNSAEDLIQQTLLACTESAHGFAGKSSFRAYLFGIARHVLFRHYNDRSPSLAVDYNESSLFELQDTPSEIAAAREEQRLLLEGLRRLPLDLQIALELHYWQGLSGRELGEALEIPEGTVRSRLHRAKEQLARHLESLARDPSTLESTLTDLDRWARSIHERAVVAPH